MALLQSRNSLDDIIERLDAREVFAALTGQTPTARSRTWHVFHAPNREDRHPSFGIRKEGAKDFATQEWYDVFDLIGLLENISDFPSKVQRAMELAGIVPARPPLYRKTTTNLPPPAQADKLTETQRESWRRAAEAEVQRCFDYLDLSGDPAAVAVREGLRAARGIKDETRRHFKLGFNKTWKRTACQVPDEHGALHNAWLPPGLVIACYADSLLLYVKVRRLTGWLARLLNVADEIKTIFNRQTGQREPLCFLNKKTGEQETIPAPKYSQLEGGLADVLFNADALTPELSTIFMEGELDVILAWQEIGDRVAPVTLGSASNISALAHLPAAQKERLQAVSQVFIALDRDQAGQTAAKRLHADLDELLGAERVYAADLGVGKDFTEFVVEHRQNARAWFDEQFELARLPHWRTLLNDGQRCLILNSDSPDDVTLIQLLYHQFPEGWPAPFVYRFTFDELWAYCQVHGFKFGSEDGRDLRRMLEANTRDPAGFLTKLPPSLDEQSIQGGNFVNNSPTPGRKPIQFTFSRAFEEYIALRLEQAKYQMLQKHFRPGDKNTTLPHLDALILKALDPGLSENETEQILEVILNDPAICAFYQKQGETAVRARLRKARRQYSQLVEDVYHGSSSSLPKGWAWENDHKYRVAFLRGYFVQRPEAQLSQAAIADLIGISERRVGSFLAEARIESERQPYEEITIRSASEATQRFKGFPLYLRSVTGSRVEKQRYNREWAGAWAAERLEQGAQVSVLTQMPNRQHVIDCPPPDQSAQPVKKLNEHLDKKPKQAKRRKARPARQIGYDPRWARQVVLSLLEQAKGIRVKDGVILNVETGEILGYGGSDKDLIALLQNDWSAIERPVYAA